MNDKPISQSKDVRLRGSMAAMQRAAQRARERARRTGTRLVVSRNGVLRHVEVGMTHVAETAADYRPKE